jgi:hypothetical protein
MYLSGQDHAAKKLLHMYDLTVEPGAAQSNPFGANARRWSVLPRVIDRE